MQREPRQWGNKRQDGAGDQGAISLVWSHVSWSHFQPAWQAVRLLLKPALASNQPVVEVVSRVAAAVSAHTALACNASAPDMMKLAS